MDAPQSISRNQYLPQRPLSPVGRELPTQSPDTSAAEPSATTQPAVNKLGTISPSPKTSLPTSDRTARQTTFDWPTHELIQRVVDRHSGLTVAQSPDQALLRLRAYKSQQDAGTHLSDTTNGLTNIEKRT